MPNSAETNSLVAATLTAALIRREDYFSFMGVSEADVQKKIVEIYADIEARVIGYAHAPLALRVDPIYPEGMDQN